MGEKNELHGKEGDGEEGEGSGGGEGKGGTGLTPPLASVVPMSPLPPISAMPQQGNTQEQDGRRIEEEGLMPHGHQAYPAQSLAPPP